MPVNSSMCGTQGNVWAGNFLNAGQEKCKDQIKSLVLQRDLLANREKMYREYKTLDQLEIFKIDIKESATW